MYSSKNHTLTPKKHQDKINNFGKNSSVRVSDKNDNIIGMVLKSLKPKVNSTDSTLKSQERNAELKGNQQSNCMSHQMQSPNKHSDKRKDEKVNNTNRKKIKIDTSVKESELSTESISPKKQSKLKSMCPKTYICKYCCRRYHSVEQLRQHSAEHGNKPTHVCHLCNHQTASFSALMTHYLKHSGNKGKDLEKIYAKSKADYSNMQLNMFSRPKSSFQCSKCKLSFSSKSKYDTHNCSAIPKKSEYNCAYCGHISVTVEEYRNHIQSHSETPFICSHCKYKAMSKKQLDTHREICKKRRKLKGFKCDKCGEFQGKSKKELNHHLKTCAKSNSSFSCSKCLLEFREKNTYEDHLLVCKNNDKQKSFAKRIIKPKKKLKESIAAKNKLVCCVCESVCNSKAEHEEHERQCLAEMANKPTEKTNSLCSTRGSVIEIAKLAQNSKICSDQNGTGIEKKSLNVDIHNTRRSARLVRRKSSFLEDVGVKKPKLLKIKISKKPKLLIKPKCRKGRQSKNPNNSFLCNYCDFTFCSKSTLLRHKRMHSGNPWYICQYCGKFFFRKDVFIRHEENVHKKSSKTVFCCYYCKLCFNESSLLREHVVTAHKDSAFLPIKQKLSGKGIMENSTKPVIKIKQEPDDKNIEINENNLDETKVDKALSKNAPLENVSSNFPSFKCSICFQSFENTTEIESHMHTHANTLDINVTNEIPKTPEIKNAEKLSQDVYKAGSLSKNVLGLNESISESNNLIDSNVPSVSSEQNKEGTYDNKDSDSNMNNEFSDIDDMIQNKDIEMSDSFECNLCSKSFSNKTLLEVHSKTLHKLVDWYQCLVCTACGPKQEMLEHMIMHMYKVGSFVVSNNGDYNNIISLQINEQKKIREGSAVCNKEQNPLPQNMTVVTDEELPPLREYGICPCIKDTSKQIGEENEELCLDVNENDSDKNAETHDCSQGSIESCVDMDSEMNILSNEPIIMSVENNSVSSDAQDINSASELEEKEALKLDETNLSEVSTPVKATYELENNLSEVSSPVKATYELETNLSEVSSPVKATYVLETNLSEVSSPVKATYVLETNLSEVSSPVKATYELETNLSEVSTPVKEPFDLDLKSEGNSSIIDPNQNDNFSQLRYLLQSPSKQQLSENKVSIYPFSQLETSGFTFDKQNLPEKHLSQQSDSLDVTNVVSKNDLNFESSKQNDVSNEINYKIPLIQENNQSINTCLKFDVNQSRSEFSENLSTSSQKTQNCAEIDKNENFFKTCPPQSTILDFSDLIHHSFENSSPSEDNLFSYATTSKQVVLHTNVDMREEVHTPDCTDMENYDSTGVHSSVKCEGCNFMIEDHNEQVNHKCSSAKKCLSEPPADIDLCQYKPKSSFQSLAGLENQNKITDVDNCPDKKVNIPTPEKSGIFICSLCSKMTISDTELLRHQKTEHVQSVHNSSHNNECTKCHRIFTDIGELMKHSLTCLKTYFLKNAVVNDSVSSSESIQTLLKKDETKTNFSNFSLNSLPFNTVSTDLSHQNSENILKNSFNS